MKLRSVVLLVLVVSVLAVYSILLWKSQETANIAVVHKVEVGPPQQRSTSPQNKESFTAKAIDIQPSKVYISMVQKSLATYYVTGNIHGRGDVEFMVDTGAGYMAINEYTLKDLQWSRGVEYIGEITGVMADGTRRQLPIYKIKEIVLGGKCALYDIEVTVFPKNTRMLLGLSALIKASPFVFSTEPPFLELSNCGKVATQSLLENNEQ